MSRKCKNNQLTFVELLFYIVLFIAEFVRVIIGLLLVRHFNLLSDLKELLKIILQ